MRVYVLLLLVGCSGYGYERYGELRQSLGGNRLGGTREFEGGVVGGGVGVEVRCIGPVGVISECGILVVLPPDLEPAAGAEGAVGLIYEVSEVLGGYGCVRQGALYGGDWAPQEVAYTSPTTVEGGLRFDIDDEYSVGVGYIFMHFCWGRSVWGASGPNPGFESGGLVVTVYRGWK